MISFWAVLLPIPGALDIVLESPASTANLKSSGDIVDNMASAPLGPIPLTVIRSLNTLRSSFVKNPYKSSASSLTYRYVCTLSSLPIAGSFERMEAGIIIKKPMPSWSSTMAFSVSSTSSPLIYDIIFFSYHWLIAYITASAI